MAASPVNQTRLPAPCSLPRPPPGVMILEAVKVGQFMLFRLRIVLILGSLACNLLVLYLLLTEVWCLLCNRSGN